MFTRCIIILFTAATLLKVSAFKEYGNSKYNSYSFGKRIINGEEALPCEFPWMVHLPFAPCGGSIIDENTVITAAHCVNPPLAYIGLTIVAGEHIRSAEEGTEQFVKIAEVIHHPEYKWKPIALNDIAILKLSTPFNLSKDCISPIRLPPTKQTFRGQCIVSGWGQNREGGPPSDVLHKVTLPLVSDEVCKQTYGNMLIESHMCAGNSEDGKAICLGDSGSPLVCKGSDGKGYLAGVVCSGGGCEHPYEYGVYTEVSFYIDWIAKNKL